MGKGSPQSSKGMLQISKCEANLVYIVKLQDSQGCRETVSKTSKQASKQRDSSSIRCYVLCDSLCLCFFPPSLLFSKRKEEKGWEQKMHRNPRSSFFVLALRLSTYIAQAGVFVCFKTGFPMAVRELHL